ncbi:MAG: hypothetical protein ACLGHP_11480, partial [Vicinamibacteria bacterium]
VSRRRGADQVRDQALSARRRIGAGFGPPKDLVALCSEAIVIRLPDHRPCMQGIGYGTTVDDWHAAVKTSHTAPRIG